MTRRNLPDINPNGARFRVRVEGKPRAAWRHAPDHHGSLSRQWASVMRIVEAYQAAGFHVSYSERWTDGRPGSAIEDHKRTRSSFRIADIVCTPPDAGADS